MKPLNEYLTPETDAAQWGTGKVTTSYARNLERRLALCRDALKMAHAALDASRMMVENEIGCCEIAGRGANAWPDLLDGRVSGGGIKPALSTVREALKATETKQ